MSWLSPADHEHFIEHGWVALRGMVPTATVAAAVAELEAAGSPGEAVEACMVDMPDVIDELFGPRYSQARRKGPNDMPRPHQPDVAWKQPTAHVDDAYPTTMPNGWAIGSFTFLTPVRSQGGAFVVFPGSYLRYREHLADACHCIKGAAQLPVNSGPGQEFLAQPGDVLLFHHLTGHTGSDNLVDPTTRHALLARWPTVERVVPDDRPFDEMSTIEKMNSARYLADRFGLSLNMADVVDDESATRTLRDGFGPGASFMTSAILHHGGQLHLLGVSDDEPTRVRHWCSDTGLAWEELAPLMQTKAEVQRLQIHQYDLDILLAVVEDGDTTLKRSRDLSTWHEIAAKPDVRAMTPWFVYAQYPSKVAGGQALFEVGDPSADRVVIRWGAGWDTVPDWSDHSEALTAPEGTRIEDVTLAAHAGDSSCTFVVDLAQDSSGDTAPWFAQPQDVAVAREPLRPLAFDAANPPRCVRIVNRAHNYWLVTYLRQRGGNQRLFWGEVDFSADMPVLHEICTPAELAAARATVGFL